MIILVSCCNSSGNRRTADSVSERPRVIISSDIGGSDPDDFQSMIHLLMYADRLKIEGLISSPWGEGRAKDILHVIDLYEKDYPRLKIHGDFPAPEELRRVTKQGSVEAGPPRGWGEPTEGSEWIISQVREKKHQPLWILVWGGLEDLAQALHDAPDIVPFIRVYWIGGPNKKWSVNSYCYIASTFPDLWMIENNSTYRGWIIDDETEQGYKADEFFRNCIMDRGAMGTDFINYYGGSIKMGDSPSVAYLLNGNPDDPTGNSWGGSFSSLEYSAFRSYDRQTTLADTVPTYSVVTWTFDPGTGYADPDKAEIWMEIAGQRINGFCEDNGIFIVRFVPKQVASWKYVIHCTEKSLDGQTGEFVSVNPWPGPECPSNLALKNWWSDSTEPELALGQYQGARTVSQWRKDFLSDWAGRFKWLCP